MAAKVKLQKTVYERAREAAAKAGYSSVDEFVEHAVEKELSRTEQAEAAAKDQLKGLGYLA